MSPLIELVEILLVVGLGLRVGLDRLDERAMSPLIELVEILLVVGLGLRVGLDRLDQRAGATGWL